MSLSQPSAHLLKWTLEVIAINSIPRHVFFESKWPNLLILKTANLENPSQYLAPDIVKRRTQLAKKTRITTSHQPIFDLPHAAKQGQHSYIPYL